MFVFRTYSCRAAEVLPETSPESPLETFPLVETPPLAAPDVAEPGSVAESATPDADFGFPGAVGASEVVFVVVTVREPSHSSNVISPTWSVR